MLSANFKATITPNSKATPTFGEGKITPVNMNTWESHCNLFFREREINNEKKVQKASLGFANKLLQDWYIANQDTYDEMSWKDFISTMRMCFLPRGWANTICAEIIAKHMDNNDNFEDFILEVKKLNARLRNTNQRLDDDALHAIVSANLVEELTLSCLEGNTADIDSYQEWKTLLTTLDARHHCILSMVRGYAACNSGNKSTTSTYSCGSGNTNTGLSGKGSAIPKLMDNDRKLLNKHKGCYKCQCFYAGHVATKAVKENVRPRGNIAAVNDVDENTVAALAHMETLDRENTSMKLEFADLFPDDIPHINHLLTDVYHRFILKDANMTIIRCQYDCPKKYREV
ncbi:hypothetical protein C8T65DRAFT_744540 [Cerioporus squamosus]|nr:hypothetical protein C8T65DRAFT_744540 [Cerioporus squamosus]